MVTEQRTSYQITSYLKKTTISETRNLWSDTFVTVITQRVVYQANEDETSPATWCKGSMPGRG